MSTWLRTTPVHVEVVQRRDSRAAREQVEAWVRAWLGGFAALAMGTVLECELADAGADLAQHVQCVTLCDVGHKSGTELPPERADLRLHVYTLDEFGAQRDALNDATTGEDLAACNVWALPSADFHGLWESLVFDDSLKEDMLRFVETAFEFEARGVDSRQVAWNRVVLLHGPPGTGKTSLCRALAQKLSVRLQHRFPRARLLELNAHGLFSKWFSESGKLVSRLFDRIQEIVEDTRLLACVLVDEVESLAHARRAALAGLEPSDSIRAVNAVLTGLDRLRRAPNALVLATSNVTGAIDVAFVDRADLVRRVGPPSARAAYAVLRGALAELMRSGVVAPTESLFALRVLEDARWAEGAGSHTSLRLWAASGVAAQARLSGRALRRLPFLARALHCAPEGPPPLPVFVEALHLALAQHLRDARCYDADDAPTAPTADKCNGH